VQLAWHHAVIRGGITPTEGLITQILHTAARHGLSELAHDAIRTRRVRGQALLEHHVAALLEALIQDDKIREAFAIVGHLRSGLIGGMTNGATRALRAWVGQHPSHIDKAWALMEDIRRNQAPEPGNVSAVDIATLNAVIGGAIDLDDMQRAIGIYKESTAFGVAPDAETLNILLSGCIQISNRDLADSLISEMKDLGVVPNVDTYESMIQLCLTQPSYEDVFYFLEEMKSAGFKPTMRIYEMIVQRCYDAFDPRWKVALAEMKEVGYEPNCGLKSLIRERTGAESRDRLEMR
jgi:pentatricopeptide repeat protein